MMNNIIDYLTVKTKNWTINEAGQNILIDMAKKEKCSEEEILRRSLMSYVYLRKQFKAGNSIAIFDPKTNMVETIIVG